MRLLRSSVVNRITSMMGYTFILSAFLTGAVLVCPDWTPVAVAEESATVASVQSLPAQGANTVTAKSVASSDAAAPPGNVQTGAEKTGDNHYVAPCPYAMAAAKKAAEARKQQHENQAESNTLPIIALIVGGVLLLDVLIITFVMKKPKK